MKRIVQTIFIHADPDVVWRYLVEKDKVPLWFDVPQGDFVEGQDWQMVHEEKSVSMWGRVLEARPPERLVMTFNHDWLQHDTVVRYDLAPKNGGTELTLTHEGWEGAENADRQIADHTEGWADHLNRLKTVLESETETAD